MNNKEKIEGEKRIKKKWNHKILKLFQKYFSFNPWADLVVYGVGTSPFGGPSPFIWECESFMFPFGAQFVSWIIFLRPSSPTEHKMVAARNATNHLCQTLSHSQGMDAVFFEKNPKIYSNIDAVFYRWVSTLRHKYGRKINFSDKQWCAHFVAQKPSIFRK